MIKNPQTILSPRLQQLQNSIQEFGPEVLRQFWDEIRERGTPMIELATEGTALVTFLWQDDGVAHNIAVIQDWGTDGIREHHMAWLPSSDLWYLTRVMRSDTLTTYQLSPSPSDDPTAPAPYQTDPLNPKTASAYLFEHGAPILFSLLELPDAPPLSWRQATLDNRGTTQLLTPLADQRRLWVYTPATTTSAPLPTLIVFDGRLYKDQILLPQILDYLIDSKQIPPLIALMVDSQERGELQCQPDFATYVADQILPWLRANYPVSSSPLQTTVLGSSLGGLAAVYVAFAHPTIFGKVLSQTGWFRWHPDEDPLHHWLARQIAEAPSAPVEFLLQVGNLEVAKMSDGGPSQLAANRYMRDTLQSKGYSVIYQEYSGGHDANSLEAALAQALVTLLG